MMPDYDYIFDCESGEYDVLPDGIGIVEKTKSVELEEDKYSHSENDDVFVYDIPGFDETPPVRASMVYCEEDGEYYFVDEDGDEFVLEDDELHVDPKTGEIYTYDYNDNIVYLETEFDA